MGRLMHNETGSATKMGWWPKSQKMVEQNKFWEWAPLVGKMFAHPVGVFRRYLEAPSSHIRSKIKCVDVLYLLNS